MLVNFVQPAYVSTDFMKAFKMNHSALVRNGIIPIYVADGMTNHPINNLSHSMRSQNWRKNKETIKKVVLKAWRLRDDEVFSENYFVELRSETKDLAVPSNEVRAEIISLFKS